MKKFIALILGLILVFGGGKAKGNNTNYNTSLVPLMATQDVVEDETDGDTKQSIEDWLMANDATIKMLGTTIAGIIGSIGGIIICCCRLRNSLDAWKKANETTKENNTNSTKEINKLCKQATQCIESNKEVTKKADEAINQVSGINQDIVGIKEALRIAYCNNPEMNVDGRAAAIEKALNANEVVNNGEETKN